MTRSLIRLTGAEGLELSSTDIKISSGDLIFATADKGINLGVTSNTASNTLDDYEEGTFDTTITYDTELTDTSPDETLTHAGNHYTKIGRFVFYAIKYFDKAGDRHLWIEIHKRIEEEYDNRIYHVGKHLNYIEFEELLNK